MIWLMALAWDAALYEFMRVAVSSLLLKGLLLLWTLALIYHLCNGVRHLVWDTGRGLTIVDIYRSGQSSSDRVDSHNDTNLDD